MFTYIFSRLKERSTWLGLIALATACGATIETVLAEQIIAAGMAIAGLIGVLTKDSTGSTEVIPEGTPESQLGLLINKFTRG